jgi:acetolactate synthase I/II/III large subunit
VPWLLERAFSIARNGKPGAVFIDIPSDLGLTEANIPAYHPAQPRHRSRAEAAAVRAAAKAIAAARRPLLLCGSGAIASSAFKAVADLSEAAGMPVFTTPGGRGIISEDAPLSLGQVGLYFSELGKAYYDRADLVLSVGSRLEEFSTGAWRYFPDGARLIQLDLDAETIGMNWRPDIALVGDAALTLEDLRAALRGIDRAGVRRRLAALERAKARHLRQVAAAGRPRDGQLRTPHILHALNRIFGRDTILVHENGGADLWSYYWPYYRVLDPGDCVPMAEQTAMGMGVIGAIGAKLARPRKKVVCVTCDGALQMAMMELATAAEQRCGVTWIVLNNRALDWPQYFLALQGKRDGITDFAVSPDFAKLAQVQGCVGLAVRSPEEIEPALTQALKENRLGHPVLIDCHIPKHDYPEHFTRFHREIWGVGVQSKAKAGRVMSGG